MIIIFSNNFINKKIMRMFCFNNVKKISILFIFLFQFLFLYNQSIAQSDTIETNVPPLKDVFVNDFLIGCLLSYRHIGFSTDEIVPGQSPVVSQNGGNLIKYHMNCMSPGNNMKPQYTLDINSSAAAYKSATTQDAKDSIDVHPIVKFPPDLIAQLNWAKRQNFGFRGHTLVWHSQTPVEFFRSGYTSTGQRLSKEKMIQRMDNYIKEIIRLIHESWPNLLIAMDVVNEAINDNTGTDRTTDSEWYITFGDNSYIMKAFEITRKYTIQYGETQMKLYYNDYNTHNPNKADGIVRICKPIYQAGLLDGIGMQEHDDISYPTAEAWIASYNKFDSVCKEMSVTELDVTTGSANPSSQLLNTQANQYAMLFKCFVERSYKSGRGKIINVSKDGLNDQYTFKTNQSSSLWTSLNKCKPAFYAVVDVGIYFNKLDSLINYAKKLEEKDYTRSSWSLFQSVLSNSINIKQKNYSSSVSASSSLKDAYENLLNAINNLTKATNNIKNNIELSEYSLSQNYPNPFNPSTKIEYSIPKSTNISLKVYNTLGEEVAVIFNGFRVAGKYTVNFDGSNLPSGVYYYRLITDDYNITRKFVLLK